MPKRPYTYRHFSEWPALARAIVRATRDDPSLTVVEIARELGCSHVTVLKHQRAAGLRPPAAVRKQVSP